MTIEYDLLMKLSEAIASLPNVKPRLAFRLLMRTREDLIMQNAPGGESKPRELCELFLKDGYFVDATGGGARVCLEEIEFAFVSGNRDEPIRLTPEGATLLVRLYEAGAFEMAKGAPREEPTQMKTYAGLRTVLEEETARLQHERVEKRRAREAMIANPALLAEDLFTWSRLNAIFAAHKGYGGSSQRMEIGGLQVVKELISFSSNSGKTRDFEVRFSWTSADGTPRELTRESQFSANRRNDSSRNWGLPE